MPGVNSDVLWTPSRPRDVSGTMASLGCANFCEVPCVCRVVIATPWCTPKVGAPGARTFFQKGGEPPNLCRQGLEACTIIMLPIRKKMVPGRAAPAPAKGAPLWKASYRRPATAGHPPSPTGAGHSETPNARYIVCGGPGRIISLHTDTG
ncbi:uncharacterized protein PGTG_00157 [Puccinia graminis f. sp. tritici CRL 75-36-700-3]|uniref:Uncharacterized protein n=1 Tax=Puccinia graminis f. sp. tritici (strain CRL 75-36-700-3 / race SCCL) TaxID=418459 RepID=E3JRP0_PUCGT|nr:uncharacterized protein PGTG_00157 [Puccinia graminis f. sp. tritici CRL 75-36-700-3]EFP74201.1 hypothetical protein PGTG_00157 [Puccinia graminis f. sp. tritici CRL 75-36-700-3]